jgi:hypothetical protein
MMIVTIEGRPNVTPLDSPVIQASEEVFPEIQVR